ncbi:dTDP-4-dehydrorhamnose reductase [Patescibacteria group bacterium]|nr:dTDP-4-dehydrorhamnose reductase [Patescibacteria group bacterium]MBU1673221.1 dTDP-4-dehydrorhamnose reductase [Patescibacteria group bacterium]MBU1964021.1 dTDP-4-dehydrorhamnose reductase [Patescibacteria group bacterium]
MKNGKILITGANGMLGQDLAQVFSDYDLLLFDKNRLDITNIDEVEKVIKKEKPNYIINAAAYTDVDGCEENKDICLAVNATGPENLAKISKKYDIKLVHYSTDYVFNGENKNGYPEDYSDMDPINMYGQSKAEGEEAIKINCDNYYIIRISWLYGHGGKNFVDTMINLGKEKDELKVVNDQHGSPTYTRDVAEMTKHIIKKNLELGVYHATNSNECTWYEFTKEIFKIKKIQTKLDPCTTDEFPRPAKRPEYSILLNTKLPKMRSWKHALKEYLTSSN